MLQGAFEPEETAVLLQHLPQTDVFVDVGANVGYYTLLALKHGKHAVAGNPSPATSSACTRPRGNRWRTAPKYFPSASRRKPGTATLYGASGPSASIVRNWAKYGSGYRQTIPVLTLDIVLADGFVDRSLFIKIDSKATSIGSCKAASAHRRRMPRVTWLIEICFDEYHPSGRNPDFSDTFRWFWSRGYEARTANAARAQGAAAGRRTLVPARKMRLRTINYLVQQAAAGTADHHRHQSGIASSLSRCGCPRNDDPFLELHQLPAQRMRSGSARSRTACSRPLHDAHHLEVRGSPAPRGDRSVRPVPRHRVAVALCLVDVAWRSAETRSAQHARESRK